MNDLSAWPTGTRVEFGISRSAVSHQADSHVTAPFIQHVKDGLRTPRFLLSGNVRLTVEWWASEQERYEKDRSPDIDNILKPLIDSLRGPEGLIIDDNQIQTVTCSWRDSQTQAQRLDVLLQFDEGEWVPKEKLVFVRFQKGLCLPIPGNESKQHRLKRFHTYSARFAARKHIVEAGLP